MSVVLTGIGIVCPTGIGIDRYWDSVLAGRHGIRPLAGAAGNYSSSLAARIEGFDAAQWLSDRLLHQTDVSTRFALAAAELALADSAIAPDALTDYDKGVITSNATGGFEFTHREFRKLWTEGADVVSVYESFAWFYAVNTGQISIRHGMRGPGTVLVAEQAGGLDAIGRARDVVRQGTPFVLCGGVDSSMDPWGWVSHIASGRLTRSTDPDRAYLPFAAEADGYVPGEGGALLVLEDGDSASARAAAHRYAEIAGHASTFDAAEDQGGPAGLARAIRLALADAGLTPGDVDAVFADAAGVPELDRSESDALTAVFGSAGPPVTAPKSGTGRLYSGGGPLDVATAALCMRDGVLPATPGTTAVRADCAVDLVLGAPRPVDVGVALVLARGRLGFNSALVLTRASSADNSSADNRKDNDGNDF
ncbi:ketosynthase chain-length factor [Nocardia terpenica]|uniref:Ketosynthase chain-length factor n=1 Tax=Nocardia terpenica TaxID=455432 RepID=A0A291RGP6_9NOCA|nr:ketosynthase chain-length factor [Nocardia terpenica]ATL66262.1 ketosynthase chain-length factor [Nocardia terpenica]